MSAKSADSVGERIRRSIHLQRAVHLVWDSAPGWTIANVALLFVQGVLPLAALYLMKLIIDSVTASVTAPDKGMAFERVALYVGLAGGVALLTTLCRSLAGLVGEAQSQVITDYVSDILHAKSIEVDLEYYENPQYFDTLHRAQQEAPYRPTRIVNGLAQMAQSGLSLVAMVGLLVSLHWAVAVVLFVASIPGILVRLRYAGKMYHWQREHTPAERRSWYFHWLLTGDGYAKEIRLFDLGPLFMRRFRELRRQLRQERFSLVTKRTIADLVVQVSATLAVFGAYAFIAYRTVHGAITLGDLVMYYQAFQRGQSFLQEMLGSLAGLYEDNLFLTSLYEFLDLRPKVRESSHPQPLPHPMQMGLVLDHVSFGYPTSSRAVLDDVSLAIRPGEHIALVGENGAGKTTLIKLLCRLYDPTGGSITLDGVDLREFSPTALRREFGVIPQDYARYQLTARENIWLGDIDLTPDDTRVDDAARLAGADEVIHRLPQGYDTHLGKWFEDGEELSVGEWQKLALARAFLRSAQIIVLDEPTSAMDAKAEFEVFRRFRQLAEGRTAILISHRFSTVRLADRICVLEGGRISEVGSHEELLRLGGTYARLFELQARYYR